MPYRYMTCASCDQGVPKNFYGHVSADGNAVWACTKGLRVRESLAEILERHQMPTGLLEDLSAWQDEELEVMRRQLIEEVIGRVQELGEASDA